MIRHMFQAPIVFVPEQITTSADADAVAFHTHDFEEWQRAQRVLAQSR